MSTEKKSVISTLENVIEDFDNIKAGMEYVGLTVGTDSTNTYGDKIKTLKKELEKVESLETVNENLNTQISIDNADFNNIYNAIVKKGQMPLQEDRSTYAGAILAIESGSSSGGSGVELTNLAYFFYNNVRTPDDYWEFVTNKVTDMNNMLNNATLTAGNTYLIDLTSCVNEAAVTNLLYDLDLSTSGTVDLVFKVGVNNTSLKGLIFGSSTPSSTSKKINFSFDENSDVSNISSLRSTITYHCFNNINLSKLSNAPLISMYQTFIGSILLGTCDFNSINTALVSTFYRCFDSFNSSYGVKSIDISNWSFDSATTVESMFYKSGLNTIVFGSKALKDMKKTSMFSYSAITTLHLNIEDTLNKHVDNNNMFDNCTSLLSVTSDNPWVLVGNNCDKLFNNNNKLTQIPEIHLVLLNDNKSTDLYLGYYAFRGCYALEDINIYIELKKEDENNTFYPQNCSYMFYNCSSLKNIRGNLDLSLVNNVSNMFYNCSALETIETSGSICGSVAKSSLTLDLGASEVFDIVGFINQLASNNSGYTRTIKLNATVYSALSEETIALAATKNYTLASA